MFEIFPCTNITYSKANFKNNQKVPWLEWLSRLGCPSITERLQVQFPVRAHAWGAGQAPGWGREATD